MVLPARRSSVATGREAARAALRSTPTLRAWCWVAFGVLAMLTSLGLYLVDPLDQFITWQTSLSPGTMAYNFFQQPIQCLYIRTYIFNVTNPEAFLAGTETMRVQELGPFTYKEVNNFGNLTLHNDSFSYRVHRYLEFTPEESVGDPKDFPIVVPNLALLGAASVLADAPLVTNLALRSLALFAGSKTLLSMSANELMWGYDDPLVSMAHSVAPFFVDFKRMGFLDRMYGEDDDVVLVRERNTGVDPTAEFGQGLYSVRTFNGQAGFPQWGHGVQPRADPHTGEALPAHMPCDTVAGSFEALLFPRHILPQHRLYVYRKQFCRAVPIHYQGDAISEDGFHYFLYHIYKPSLLDPQDDENNCYCATSAGIQGACSPSGFSSISPCYYRMPVSLSQPHMMDADPAITSRLEGLQPDVEKHISYFKLQPDTGIPLNVRCRVQLNLMVGNTRLSYTQPFNNKALPLIWLDMEMNLPDEYRQLLKLALIVGPPMQVVFLVAMALAGAAMVARGWLLYRRRPRPRSRSPHIPLGPRLRQRLNVLR